MCLALQTGVILIAGGILQVGFIVENLLSAPVLSGFTQGAAVLIVMSQLKHVLGIGGVFNNLLSLRIVVAYPSFSMLCSRPRTCRHTPRTYSRDCGEDKGNESLCSHHGSAGLLLDGNQNHYRCFFKKPPKLGRRLSQYHCFAKNQQADPCCPRHASPHDVNHLADWRLQQQRPETGL